MFRCSIDKKVKMAKNRFRVDSSRYESVDVVHPEMQDIDSLAILTDDELGARARTLEGERTSMLVEQAREANVIPWEVEIAYVRREQQIRKLRRDAHEAYLERLQTQRSAKSGRSN
jgi:hypothetical protein